MQSFSPEIIARRLDADAPPVVSSRLAAVSLIIGGTKPPSVLLIKRSEHSGDPWSGQVALPGGKMDEADESVLRAAIRETREEVGVDLEKGAKLLGFFGAFKTHTGTMDVIPAAFYMRDRGELKPNEEVSSCRWVSLDQLQARESRSTYHLSFGPISRDMPAIKVGDYVIWGLTLRILEVFLERLKA